MKDGDEVKDKSRKTDRAAYLVINPGAEPKCILLSHPLPCCLYNLVDGCYGRNAFRLLD
jgi:hypothetical protein